MVFAGRERRGLFYLPGHVTFKMEFASPHNCSDYLGHLSSKMAPLKALQGDEAMNNVLLHVCRDEVRSAAGCGGSGLKC